MEIPYIPKDAPYSGDQKMWLGGFLAGLHSKLALNNTPVVANEEIKQSQPIDILYGTQTGNSEEIANEAASLAQGRGFNPRVAGLDSIEVNQLASMDRAIFVISTYGEGEMPDNAQLFWDAISASTAPRLETLEYGVIALGDTSYEHFCEAGKLVDTRLEQLGAKRFAPRLDCDVDYEEPSQSWLKENIPSLGDDFVKPTSVSLEKPKWNKKNPYLATLSENSILSGPKSAKEIRHIVFDFEENELSYETGDALGVVPTNSPDLVKLWLDRFDLDYDHTLDGMQSNIGDLLSRDYEISNPSNDLLYGLEPLLENKSLSEALSDENRDKLDKFLWGKDIMDLLNIRLDIKFDLTQIMGWLKPLQHRAYSISSSPLAHPNQIHLTVATVRWDHNDRAHGGVCSTYLADMIEIGGVSPVFMLPNKSFRIPDDNQASMIMVGPGTGIAPFRAFLEERREIGATGYNWLFFGDQHRECDYIYEDEISDMTNSGLLNKVDVAFSRDQKEKQYVQHKMLDNGKDLFKHLDNGGYFYVCGDASRMAKDVDNALHQVIQIHGDMNSEKATEFVGDLKRQKRYLRDVY